MFWKSSSYVKAAGQAKTPCSHNTCNIPDHMVMASSKDNPKIEIRYDFKSIEERTEYEVLAVIRCMNDKGKFVSKEWICHTLNFKSRKADDIMSELKRQGLVQDFMAIRDGRVHGYYYRVAGKKAMRAMQRKHASMRREMRGEHLKSLPNSPDGSLSTREEKTNTSQISGEEQKLKEETKEKKLVPKTEQGLIIVTHPKLNPPGGKVRNRHHTDGSLGDGLKNTQYTAAGCYARLTDKENHKEDVKIAENFCKLASQTSRVFHSILARSLCRRIDSGALNMLVINKLSRVIVAMGINPTLYELVYNFEDILARGSETFETPEELEDIASRCVQIVDITPSDQLRQDYLKASDFYKQLQSYAFVHEDNGGELSSLCLSTHRVRGFSCHAALFGMHQNNVSDELMLKFVDANKDDLFVELSNNNAAVVILRDKLRVTAVNWFEFASFRVNYLHRLRADLYVDGLKSAELDKFYYDAERDELMNRRNIDIVLMHQYGAFQVTPVSDAESAYDECDEYVEPDNGYGAATCAQAG